MTKCTLRVHVFLSASLLAPTLASADGHNALADPGFEKATSENTAWTVFDGGRYSNDIARDGRQAMFNWGFSRTVSYPPYFIGSVSGSYQEIDATPGSQWRLKGFGSVKEALQGTPAFGILQISFFDADGNDLETAETAGNNVAKAKISNEVNSKAAPGEWVALDTGVATAPDGSATIQAFTLYIDYSGSNVSQGVYFDDLALCEVSDDRAGACQ